MLGEDFSKHSDVDFLYEFEDAHLSHKEELDHFLEMIAELQKGLAKKVDFVWANGLKNPYFKEEVEHTKVLIYAQEPGISEKLGFYQKSKLLFEIFNIQIRLCHEICIQPYTSNI